MTTYEELPGASGRRIYYRAERFDPKHLFSGTGPDTFIDGRPHKLVNISISGVAALDRSANHTEQEVGEIVPIQMRIENTPLHEGYGKIVRVEDSLIGSKVALKLTDKYLDVTRLVKQYKEHNLRRDLRRGRMDNLGLAHKDYRLLCADALHLLRCHKIILGEWEERNADKRNDPRFGREFLDLASEQILPSWRSLSETANDYIDDFIGDPRELDLAKEFTELVLSPELFAGPIWHRAYEKPLGYPGDFEVMNYVYSWLDQGENLYAKLCHRLGLDALECVASRMSMVQQIIAQEAIDKPGNSPINITNLACGSAQEVENYFSQERLLRPVNFTLIDQDEQALTNAYEKTFRHAIRLNGRARLQCLHTSFTELLQGGELSVNPPPQDLIYSVGLFDYLKERRARSLLEALYQRLVPGGLLVIGNLKLSRKAGRWAGEMICDWPMIYRTEREMQSLVTGLKPEKVELLTDRTDKIYLLCVRKPSAQKMAA